MAGNLGDGGLDTAEPSRGLEGRSFQPRVRFGLCPRLVPFLRRWLVIGASLGACKAGFVPEMGTAPVRSRKALRPEYRELRLPFRRLSGACRGLGSAG